MAKAKQVSPSNLAEKSPVSGAASAGGKGHQGAALWETIKADVYAAGAILDAMAGKRKTRLLALIQLDKDARAEFNGMLSAEMERINDNARSAGLTVEMYMEDFPKEGAIYAETSMWKGLWKAVDAGWSPRNDSGDTLPYDPAQWPAWRLLKMDATKYRDSIGKPSADPANPNRQPAAKRGRPAAQPKTVSQKVGDSVKRALKDDKGITKLPSPEEAARIVAQTINTVAPKANRNLAETIAMLIADATVEELREVAAVVESALKRSEKAAEDAAKAAAKASKSSAEAAKGPRQQATSAGATVTHRKAGEPEVAAVPPTATADALIERGRQITRSQKPRAHR